MAILGYNVAGSAGTTSLEDSIVGSEFTTGSGGPFTVDKISAHYNPSATPFTTKCAIYTSGGSLVANSGTPEVSGVSGAAFRDFTYSGTKPVLSASTAYILVAWCQSRAGTNVLSRDAGDVNQGKSVTSTYAASFPSSVTFTNSNNKFSVYATIHVEKSLTGGLTLSVNPAATLVYNEHPQISGSVAVSFAIASGFEFTGGSGQPQINGSITVQVLVDRTTWDTFPGTWDDAEGTWDNPPIPDGFTRNASVSGGVVVPVTVASALDYTTTINAVINGDIQLATSVSAALDYTFTRAISGDITVATTVASAFEHASTRSISGDVQVATSVAASLDYTSTRSISGDVQVATAVAAALDYTFTRSIPGDIQVTASVASGMQYQAPGQYQINGNITVTPSVDGITDYTRNAAISGAVAVSPSVAGGMAYSSHSVLAGAITVDVAVASGMAFQAAGAEYLIDGSITLQAAASSTTDYTRNAGIAGSIAVTPAVSSTTEYSFHGQISGAISVAVSIASTLAYLPEQGLGRIAITDYPIARVVIAINFMTYDIGDVARIAATFTSVLTDAVADPTTVTITVKPPRTTAVVYTYDAIGGVVVKDSTGVYHLDIPMTTAGRWRVKVKGEGQIAAVEEYTLFVRPSSV